ncbi:unnamed protein product [Aureobasidium uvarum]|uniref:Uncharacterized protein n=1 Tax=Aureobasidium uvarum TaxID=2773716 RepID=A0A9N8PN32_9PEZI|nr:unnamed protein product [Aureobasidium uvarum]
MTESERITVMDVHITFNDTKHNAEHTKALAPEEPTDDASLSHLPFYEVDGYGDDYDPDNKPCADHEQDCPVEQSGAVELGCAEDHTDYHFLSSTIHRSNINNAPVAADLYDDLAHTLDLESIPVLDDRFRNKNARSKLVARYIKLTLAKFVVVRDVKETETELSKLMMAMQTLEIDKGNVTITEADGPAQKVIKTTRAIRKLYPNVDRAAKRNLKPLSWNSGARVPEVYNQNKEADLCGTWYAIVSDRHYRNNKLLIPSCLYETRVLLITHLHLLGGTPAHYTVMKKLNYTSYQQFIDLLPDLLSYSRCEQAVRLGYSTSNPTVGPWKYQFAPSLDALDPECWTELCEENYEQMKGRPKHVVFSIRAADQNIPLAIAAKVQSRPTDWNIGAGSMAPVPVSNLPPPCFLPSPLSGAAMALVSPVLAFVLIKEVSLPSRPAKKRSNMDDGQQESKKAKIDE